jgi:hypothetical protein
MGNRHQLPYNPILYNRRIAIAVNDHTVSSLEKSPESMHFCCKPSTSQAQQETQLVHDQLRLQWESQANFCMLV